MDEVANQGPRRVYTIQGSADMHAATNTARIRPAATEHEHPILAIKTLLSSCGLHSSTRIERSKQVFIDTVAESAFRGFQKPRAARAEGPS